LKATSAFLKEAIGAKPQALVSSILANLKASSGEYLMLGWVPFTFRREGKTFKGVYAFGDKHILRFEFFKNVLVNISVYITGQGLDDAPSYMVEIETADATSAMKSIVAALASGKVADESVMESTIHSKALQEATSDDIRAFVDAEGDEGGTLSSMYRKYVKWAEANGVRVVSDITFGDYLKKLRGGSAPQQDVRVVRGVADDPGNALPEYDDFEKDVLQNDVLYKYEMMNEIVRRIVTWDPLYKNAFIYGTGGIGKTFGITQTCKAFGNMDEILVLSGAISGFTGMLQVLWENREKKIIILDDCDTVIANETALNLLKKAMDSNEPRIVSYVRFKRGGSAPAAKEGLVIDVSHLHEGFVAAYADGELLGEEKVTAAEARWYEKVSGEAMHSHALVEALDIADASDEYAEDDQFALDANIDPAYGMTAEEGVPDSFQFTSRIIFISNLLQVPQPLLDRCILVGMIFTKEQVLDLIESLLDKIMAKEAPQVTLETKKEVLAFMRKYVHRITKPLTFRLFSQLCALFHSGHPDAKKLGYMTMADASMKTKLR